MAILELSTGLGGDNEMVKVGGNSTTKALYVDGLASGLSSVKTITRTADTVLYGAGDVIGAAPGSTAAIEFTNIGYAGKPLVITDANLMIGLAAVPAGMTSFRLHLYSATPPSAYGDNVAWDIPAGDRSVYLGYVDLGTPVDLTSTLFVQNTAVNKGIVLTTTSVFGYLVTTASYTPAASTEYTIRLVARTWI